MKIATYLLFCALFLQGCSLFEARQAEPPTSYASRDFSQYGDIIDAIMDIYSSPGRSNDINQLFDDTLFLFTGDSLDAADLPSGKWSWGRQDEVRVTNALLSDTASVVSFFANTGSNAPSPIYISSDSVVERWNYRFERNDGARFAGTSEFTIVRRQNRFYLHAWKDTRNTGVTDKSWGRWKMEKY